MYVDLELHEIRRLLDACIETKNRVPRGSRMAWNDIIRKLDIWLEQAGGKPRKSA